MYSLGMAITIQIVGHWYRAGKTRCVEYGGDSMSRDGFREPSGEGPQVGTNNATILK